MSHMSHMSHPVSVTRSKLHFGPSLEYQFWNWSFPGVPVLALVPAWSTQFGFGPSLEYLLW